MNSIQRKLELQLSNRQLTMAITELYKIYLEGEWKNDPSEYFENQSTHSLYILNYNQCILHKDHEKFGSYVLEDGHGYSRDGFCFFDYSSMVPVFRWLNSRGSRVLPNVPTYHALPEDRQDYKLGIHEW